MNIGLAVARILQIDLASAGTPSIPPHPPLNGVLDDTYIEDDPTITEWLAEHTPSWKDVGNFILGLFPFLSWIGRYNLQWFYGDLVAGITVGAVVIPQGMAYAGLALLPPEFGLYSSFVGVLLYWFFATSKDITIGPVAVMSSLVGNVVAKLAETHPNMEPYQVASALAVVAGCIVLFLGLARLGFLVDYIPLPAIAAFMTGSALNIAVGQIPTLMGIKGFNTRESTYQVFINVLKHLGRTKVDAVLGLSALFVLYFVRWATTSWGTKRFPKRKKALFFISTLRTAFAILMYTLISWLINMSRRDNPAFNVVGRVPRGFQHMGVPKINAEMISSFAPELPATVIVLLIEHIAISKSFGRVNNYTINPSQELIAIGVTNIFGPFFGAYPATGSFSRTAIKSKAGVRTPFAGVITAVIVLLAIYALTSVFFYIPQAALSAVIIHAVGDLITPPNTVYKFWRISPVEVLIFFAGVITTIFSSIENGIYVTVSLSGALLLLRIAKARGRFLGQVTVRSVTINESSQSARPQPAICPPRGLPIVPSFSPSLSFLSGPTETRSTSGSITPGSSSGTPVPILPQYYQEQSFGHSHGDDSTRNVFLPINRKDGSNPSIDILQPYPGVLIYRFSEGLVYSNAGHYTDYLVGQIFKWTRRGPDLTLQEAFGKPGDRPWNDPGPQKQKKKQQDDGDPAQEVQKPLLRAIILDFSSVNNVDITSVQTLIDVRNQLDRYAAPDKVEWHFAGIANRWTKRALASAGFGVPANAATCMESDIEGGAGGKKRWKPVFSVTEIGIANDASSGLPAGRQAGVRPGYGGGGFGGITKSIGHDEALKFSRRKITAVNSVTRPFFHPDLDGAVRSAILNTVEDG